MKLTGPHRRERRGFTLAEVAVTLVIVGITLLLILQGLNSSRAISAQSNNRKIALQLALNTIGRVERGLFWEDLDGLPGTFNGTYAEEGYEDYVWELIIGDDEFTDQEDDQQDSGYFDNLAYRRYQEEQARQEDDQQEEAYAETGTTGGPFERVVIRVTFPRLTDQSNEVTLERWIPLEQVFGRSDEQIAAEQDAQDAQDASDQGASGGGG